MSPPIDLREVDAIVDAVGREPEHTLPLLQKLQERFRYLPPEALRRVCERTAITPAALAGVATFYSQFRHRPVGRHVISICHGTACHVKGSGHIQEALVRRLGLKDGADTDADGTFTLQPVACLGCCTLAPVLQIDGITYGHLTPEGVAATLADFLALEKRGVVADRHDGPPPAGAGLAEIRVGVGSCCIAGGSMAVRTALERAVQRSGAPAVIKPVGCVGMCHQTPLVEVVQPGRAPTLYARVQAPEAARIVSRHFRPKGLVRRLRAGMAHAIEHAIDDANWTPVTRYALDVRDAPVCAFLGRQTHIATESCGDLDPLDIDEYEAHEGFLALRACLGVADPASIVDCITRSGLRGRGGGGFSTGVKWQRVRAAAGSPKYVIMNGDEGDPGAFMDRMLMESYPYRILEGLAIAARAVGAAEGVLYIRAEYPLALRRIREAIQRMEDCGIIGERAGAMGGVPLRLRICEGAGAFVSGEETGLLEAVEGRRSMPRFRPPYPADQGLWGKPTLINNVETLAMVPWILRHGAEAFAALGTSSSRGTKVFSLAGKVARGGLIEVPMGITIREIVDGIGGGTLSGRPFKAVQVGGPSGGCIPAALADTRVDYEALAEVGAIMGSGGMVVLDDTDCMVDIARYFMEFTQRESCGKCTHCRIGTKRMLEILQRLCRGEGRADDLEKLEGLGATTRSGSLCGLGRTAPNPVLSTLRYFRDEYEEHLRGRCPAKRCTALIRYAIKDTCIGCTRCAQRCPVNAIPLTPYQVHTIDQTLCTRCDTCRQVCPANAVEVR